MNSTIRRGPSMLRATSLLFAAFALAACSTPTESERNDDGEVTERNENASVFDMKIGDCFDEPADDELVESLPAVPCADPHDLEVFAVEQLKDEKFPGDKVVADRSDVFCSEAFDSYVGVAYDDSKLDFMSLFPTTESWEQDDRAITCLIGEPKEDGTLTKLTGTLKNAKR